MLFNSLLVVHIFFGTIAIISAVVAMFAAKGRLTHRRFGRYFFYSMSGIFLTAIPMAILHKSTFLFCIAIFSYYLAYTGWRYAIRRQLPASLMDKIISFGMLMVSCIMLLIAYWLWGSDAYQHIVLLVFGLIGLNFSLQDVWLFRKNAYPPNERISRHISAMMGGTIAVFTAVLVTNVSFQPAWVLWLAPTVILVPVIIYYQISFFKHPTIK